MANSILFVYQTKQRSDPLVKNTIEEVRQIWGREFQSSGTMIEKTLYQVATCPASDIKDT